MAEIFATKSGNHIRGNDAFLVLKEVSEKRIKLPKLTPSSKTKTKVKKAKPVKPVTITVTRPRLKPEAEQPKVGNWFGKLESITKKTEREDK